VRRDVLGGYRFVHTRLVVDRARRRLTLLRGERLVLEVPVGIGVPSSPTPAGEFYIRNKVTSYRSPSYGPIAFGTSARSSVLTDWPAGGYVGIHGTDRPDLIPGEVSHGCVRLRNRDILALARLMPVGTPVTIT
jgi:lipoprotein-anchoring transpeptidase ErfK/SrfK